MGFFEAFDRPFDLILDWSLLVDGVNYLTRSYGDVRGSRGHRGVVLFAAAVVVAMALSVLRLSRSSPGMHATIRGIAVLSVAWVSLAAFGVQVTPGVPAAVRQRGQPRVRPGAPGRREPAGPAAVQPASPTTRSTACPAASC